MGSGRGMSKRSQSRDMTPPTQGFLDALTTKVLQDVVWIVTGVNNSNLLLSPCKEEGWDYQMNCAFALAKKLGRDSQEVAEKIARGLSAEKFLDKAEASGKGFVNLRLSDAMLLEMLTKQLHDNRLLVPFTATPKRTVLDYGSPNLAKELHVGHLRSLVIGDALARTLEFCGHEVIRQNHVGDWGSHFGLIIQYLDESGKSVNDFASLSELYQKSKQKAAADEDFTKRAKNRTTLLQTGDEDTCKTWKGIVDLSKAHLQTICDRLGVSLSLDDVRGESSHATEVDALILELEKNGILREDNGVIGFFDSDTPAPLLVRKSDGTYLYGAIDLATIKHRIQDLGAEEIIYVVDARQQDHFAMVFAAAKQAGLLPPEVKAKHIEFGTVTDEYHKPFQTRSGDVIQLESLIDQVVSSASKIITQKNPSLSKKEHSQVAESVGTGAIKYADLASKRQRDYVFNLERMLDLSGNSAPYLQYACVRAQHILEKEPQTSSSVFGAKYKSLETEERELIIKLAEFPVVVEEVEHNLEPHRLCTYLNEVANNFSKFYERCPVTKENDVKVKQRRRNMCEVTLKILSKGLDLLGIQTVDNM